MRCAALTEELADAGLKLGAILEYFAFPQNEDPPPGSLERRHIGRIPLHVAGEFWCPVPCIRFRLPAVPAIFLGMLVPEAAVDEDDLLSGPEDEVWLSRQVFGVETVSVS